MNERYPEGTPRPSIDQELWERASIVKKNYVKGQGQRRRPIISGTGSSATQSTQSSGYPAYHTPADCVRAICQDRDLLRILGGHLQSLSPDELAEAVAAAAAGAGAARQKEQVLISFNFTIFFGHWFCFENSRWHNEALPAVLLESSANTFELEHITELYFVLEQLQLMFIYSLSEDIYLNDKPVFTAFFTEFPISWLLRH